MSDSTTSVARDVEYGFENNVCPTDGCRAPTKRGRVMCAPCWRRVPVDVKSHVRAKARYGTWDDWVDAMCHAVHASEVQP